MRACEDYIDLISARLDGSLSQEEEGELEEHLARCPACRALADELAEIHAAFPDLEELSAPEGFARGVMDRLGEREEKKTVIPLFARPQIRALAGLAACAVLCIGIYRSGVWKAGGAANKMAASGVEIQADAPAAAAGADSGAAAAEGDPFLPEQKLMISCLPTPDTEEGEANSSDRVESDPSLAGSAIYEVAGRTVDAVLTLTQLPEGAEEVLGADVEWLTDEQGRTYCIVTGEQMDALAALAQTQGQDLTGAVPDEIGADALCAVVLAG